MLPALLKLRLATTMMAGYSASTSPLPLPAETMAVLVAGHAVEPIDVKLYDENMRIDAEVAIERDGSTDAETAKELNHLFRCRRTGREKPLAQKTLAMIADVSETYGKTIEFVSVVRLGSDEEWESPHRKGLAFDFRIRGVGLSIIRDYVWKKYSDVGVGWYPSEQFLHIDTRPAGIHDTAWTFSKGVNYYHPYWSELARKPVKPTPTAHTPGA